MVFFEIKKLFSSYRFIIPIAAVLLQIAFQTISSVLPANYTEHPYSEYVYEKWCGMLEGDYTDEKYRIISDRADEIYEIIAKKDEMTLSYQSDEITLGEFSEYNEAYDLAVSETETIEYMLEKFEYYKILANEGKTPQIFYDTAWSDYLNGLGFEYIAAIAVLCMIIPIFDNEYRSEITPLLLSSKNGRKKLYRIKLITAITAGFFTAFITLSAELAAFICQSGEYYDMSIYSIVGFGGDFDMSILGFCIMNILIRSFSWAALSAAVCLLSILSENTAATFFLSVFISVCLAFVSDITESGFLSYVFCADALSHLYNGNGSLPLVAAVMLIKLIVYSFAGEKMWLRKP